MATLKTGWMKKLINGVSEKIFAISHVKSVYYNYAEKKTLANKLDEIDNQLSSVNNWITLVDWVTEASLENGAGTYTVSNLINYKTLSFTCSSVNNAGYWSKTHMIPVTLFRENNGVMIDMNPFDSNNHLMALLQYHSDTSVNILIEKVGWNSEPFKVKVMAQA